MTVLAVTRLLWAGSALFVVPYLLHISKHQQQPAPSGAREAATPASDRDAGSTLSGVSAGPESKPEAKAEACEEPIAA